MNLRSLSLLAAVLLLAACSTSPTTTENTSGGTSTAAETQAGPAPGSREDFTQNVGDRVFFDFNESAIKPEGRQTLQKQAAWLQKYTNVTVTVEGHCDDRGTREYNLALGARRANAVKEYLVSLGVSAGRLETISYGKERPMCTESSESCYAQNRRGVTTISGGANS